MPTTLALYYLSLVAISFLQDDNSIDFSGLGKQLLGGFVLAVVAAVAYTFLRTSLARQESLLHVYLNQSRRKRG